MTPKGKCPGDTGYKPMLKGAPDDFTAYQKQNAAKNAAGN